MIGQTVDDSAERTGIHTCAPPRNVETRPQTLWSCPRCGAIWEAAPDGPGLFDFERNEAVTRANWILVEAGDARFGVA
jgi:hypothetical protein